MDAEDIRLNDPWERQPGETAKAFKAFCVYRDMGLDRTLTAAWRLMAVNSRRKRGANRAVQEWYQKNRWKERARAWDNEQDRLLRSSKLHEIKDMGKRHAQQGKAMQIKGIAKLQKIKDNDLTPSQALDYILEGTKLERLAVGEPTERSEVLSRLTFLEIPVDADDDDDVDDDEPASDRD
jgi:hypothetical protein